MQITRGYACVDNVIYWLSGHSRERQVMDCIVPITQIDHVQRLINIIHFNSLSIYYQGHIMCLIRALHSLEDMKEKDGRVPALRNLRVVKTLCEIGNLMI